MTTKKILRQVGCVLILCSLLITRTGQQYMQCVEFKSPMLLRTDDTRVGYLQLPLEGALKYRPGQVCGWVITTDLDGYVIRLQVDSCSLQGKDLYGDCNNDYVDVFDIQDEQPVFTGRFCGKDVGQIFESTGQRMVVQFHSDENYEFSGFKASYQAVKPVFKDDQKSDNTTQLAIGIPCAILVLALIVGFSVGMLRLYRAKKALSRRRSLHTIPPQGRITSRPSRPQTRRPDMSPFMEAQNVAGGVVYGYDSRQLPLQVVVPRLGQDIPSSVRSATPPPSYESLGYDATGVGPGGDTVASVLPPPYEESQTAPPYEAVLKENMDDLPASDV